MKPSMLFIGFDTQHADVIEHYATQGCPVVCYAGPQESSTPRIAGLSYGSDLIALAREADMLHFKANSAHISAYLDMIAPCLADGVHRILCFWGYLSEADIQAYLSRQGFTASQHFGLCCFPSFYRPQSIGDTRFYIGVSDAFAFHRIRALHGGALEQVDFFSCLRVGPYAHDDAQLWEKRLAALYQEEQQQRPLVSFVITVYNLEAYITPLLDSILSQNIDDFEIMLVDNASTDGSAAICTRYAAQHGCIRFYGLKGDSVSGRAHRLGIFLARGDYIHLIDGDDLLVSGSYRQVYDFLNTFRPDLLDIPFVSLQDGQIRHKLNVRDTAMLNRMSKDQMIDYLMDHPPFFPNYWKYVVKREHMVRAAAAFIECLNAGQAHILADRWLANYGDVFLTCLNYALSNTIRFSDEPVYIYRNRKHSESKAHAVKHCANWFVLALVLQRALPAQSHPMVRFILHNYFRAFDIYFSSLSDAQIDAFVQLVQLKIDPLQPSTENESDYNHVFLELVRQKGLYAASRQYGSLLRSLILRHCGAHEVYVAPAGKLAPYLVQALEASGLAVSGLLDNDAQKCGQRLHGLPVYPLSELKFQHAVVFLATHYDQFEASLRTQLLSLGVHPENIVSLSDCDILRIQR